MDPLIIEALKFMTKPSENICSPTEILSNKDTPDATVTKFSYGRSSSVKLFKYIIEANIRWLKNFNLKTFKPNLHQFYIKEASIKQKNCYK